MTKHFFFFLWVITNLFCYRCALVHAARNGHLDVVVYLLTCDWVVDTRSEEVELCEAAQQALVAAAAQGHNEVCFICS